MIIDDLQQHEPIVYQILQNALQSGKIGHSFLFSGPKNPLKLPTACFLARAITKDERDFCPEHDRDLDRIQRGEHADVILIDGSEQSIRKEMIEAVMERFAKTPIESVNKVYIINNINNASLKVLNMILKFMEEPSGNDTYGILISDQTASLPETIISRCIDLPFHQITRDLIERSYLETGFEPHDAYLLSRIFNDFVAIDLNDKNFLTARDMKDKTLEYLHDPRRLAIYFYTDIYSIKEGTEIKDDKGYHNTFEFKKAFRYYLSIMIAYLGDALNYSGDDAAYKEELAIIGNHHPADLLAVYLAINDKVSYNYNYRLLCDELCYGISKVV